MNGDMLLEKSGIFEKYLNTIKKEIDSKFPWYPYGRLNNFIHLKAMFNKRPLDSLAAINSKILDIGAADGDLSFFLESLGYQLSVIDNGPTNTNNLKAIKLIKERIKSKVGIDEIDIDSQFKNPNEKYDLVFF